MPQTNSTDQLRSWLIILAIIFGVSFLAIVWIFSFSDFKFLNIHGLETSSRIDYGIKALTTIGATFGGIALLINSYYASRTANAANETARAANENAKAALKNAKIAEDKQITERFAKAVEMLGNDKPEVRLGGIYTLERIANDSSKDHWTIMEVLTAFVRENAPVKEEGSSGKQVGIFAFLLLIQSGLYQLALLHLRHHQEEKTEEENSPKLRTDIQAALTVIGRLNGENDQEDQRLDLSNVDIRGANLQKAKLQRANLKKSNLKKANLQEAKLQGANLCEAVLQEAELQKADLQNAFLQRANLRQAKLQEADLRQAYLYETQLENADLDQANLQKATLSHANLQFAFLYQTKLQEAILYKANLQGSEIIEADLQGTQLKGAKMPDGSIHEG
ncbi:MAG TPA: pentapeptide repeat-containing protein [Nostocaceae cyanobacterium]|nr:pentapeptide repeat-containing protein [Nostocaceae cyanobacterium]